MAFEISLRLVPEVAADEGRIRDYIEKEKSISRGRITALCVKRKSVDARKRQVYVNLMVEVFLDGEEPDAFFPVIHYPNVAGARKVVVVGAGPGGLFAALRLIELGLCPVLLERGKDVHARRKDIAQISQQHQVNPESNYSFGEGGAGAYSDGKLYTRSKKRGDGERILQILCQHGASQNILSEAHPHIGTDKLPTVIESIRRTILDCGGEIHFQTKVEDLLRTGQRVCGVRDALGREWLGPVILATGHSARDTYRGLNQIGVYIQPKGVAMGVRVEHPACLIDRIQYHSKDGRGNFLPAAEYALVAQEDGRGVYSFCMCPGGFVVPAASGPEQIVVNGMSPSHRGSKWSNSGIVVEMRTDDLEEESLQSFMREAREDASFQQNHERLDDKSNPLRMMYLQEALEKRCWQQGNMRQTAPAQRMGDFLRNRLSYDLPESSYAPGLISSPLHFWMPSFITKRLQQGLVAFDRKMHGFVTQQAVLIAMETRTSSPLRIVRDEVCLQSVNYEALFPCGEGAGYAGGIVSAAIDGERCAEAAAAYLNANMMI